MDISFTVSLLYSTEMGGISYNGGTHGFCYKLRLLKHDLSIWDKEVFGNIFKKVEYTESLVQRSEIVYDTSPTEESRLAYNAIQAEYRLACTQELAYWQQKARVKWLKEGEANTAYYHAIIRDRHRGQYIHQIQ